MNTNIGILTFAAFLATLASEVAWSQEVDMSRNTVDGGGAMHSTGGGFELSATIGQTDAGVLTGSGFELTGGFWFQIPLMDCDEDGDVRISDHARFVACDLGPAEVISTECRCFDVNASDTVDLRDFAAFQRAFTGPPPGDPRFTTLTGLVHLPDGSAVADATVELLGLDRFTVTGSDGGFVLADVSTQLGDLRVLATATIGEENLLGSVRVVETVGGGITDVGIITLRKVVHWVSPSSGIWSDDANWDAPFAPGADLSVVIDVPDVEITVTREFDTPRDGPLAHLICNEHLVVMDTLSVAGLFQMNNTLEMRGTLKDTTVDLGPDAVLTATAALGNQVLDGVTVNGPIDLFVNTNTGFRILNGLTLNGEIRMTGRNLSFDPFLTFLGSGTFIDGNATISFLSDPSLNSIGFFNGDFLRIGPNVTIRGAAGAFGFGSFMTLVNDGLIHSDLPGLIRIGRVFNEIIPDWTNDADGENGLRYLHDESPS